MEAMHSEREQEGSGWGRATRWKRKEEEEEEEGAEDDTRADGSCTVLLNTEDQKRKSGQKDARW